MCEIRGNISMADTFSGNKTTLETRPRELGIDVQKALLEFHEKYYSANIMSLTVIGKGKITGYTDIDWKNVL